MLGQTVNAYLNNLRFSKSWKPLNVSDHLPLAKCTASVSILASLCWIELDFNIQMNAASSFSLKVLLNSSALYIA